MAFPHNFKYNHIYRSIAGKLYLYKGSTCSSSKYGNSFSLTFKRLRPEPVGEGYYEQLYITFPMFQAQAECNTWVLDEAATILYFKKDKEYFKNRKEP